MDARARLGVVGFAVAGGRSRRMGRDKATLPWGEGDLLDHALDRLRTVTRDVRILSGPTPAYENRGVPVAVDVATDIGAMAALVTALRALPAGGSALLLAVDLPLVPSVLLGHLVAARDGFDAVVPISARGAEPLCAIYGAACLPPVERSVAGGDYKMTGFWPHARIREIDLATLRTFGDPDGLFLNVNAPEEYRAALSRLRPGP
jgi:molybdopterin-guanine dinucleotide biosynthesis protein A